VLYCLNHTSYCLFFKLSHMLWLVYIGQWLCCKCSFAQKWSLGSFLKWYWIEVETTIQILHNTGIRWLS
jgi:hypothetical protein